MSGIMKSKYEGLPNIKTMEDEKIDIKSKYEGLPITKQTANMIARDAYEIKMDIKFKPYSGEGVDPRIRKLLYLYMLTTQHFPSEEVLEIFDLPSESLHSSPTSNVIDFVANS